MPDNGALHVTFRKVGVVPAAGVVIATEVGALGAGGAGPVTSSMNQFVPSLASEQLPPLKMVADGITFVLFTATRPGPARDRERVDTFFTDRRTPTSPAVLAAGSVSVGEPAAPAGTTYVV
ncbi:MAG: hypothetical protein EBS05_21875 [Proteobacteria bacterium]|nr:hypothetical protein [Pseudomonadota bacterium]